MAESPEEWEVLALLDHLPNGGQIHVFYHYRAARPGAAEPFEDYMTDFYGVPYVPVGVLEPLYPNATENADD